MIQGQQQGGRGTVDLAAAQNAELADVLSRPEQKYLNAIAKNDCTHRTWVEPSSIGSEKLPRTIIGFVAAMQGIHEGLQIISADFAVRSIYVIMHDFASVVCPWHQHKNFPVSFSKRGKHNTTDKL